MKFQSTKTYGHEVGLSCCFRQHRAHSHCNKLHGYALAVKFTFECEVRDHCGWVVDFGGMKSLKGILEDNFDHKLIVAEDDPEKDYICSLAGLGIADVLVFPSTGCESFAAMIFSIADQWLYDNGFAPRVWLVSVEVSEHGGNSALCLGETNE